MKELLKDESFCRGLNTGLHLYQQKILIACERKEPLIIDGNLYYLQSGKERLAEFIEKICQ